MHGLDVGSEAIEKEVNYLYLYVHACFGKYLGCFLRPEEFARERKIVAIPFSVIWCDAFFSPKIYKKRTEFP